MHPYILITLYEIYIKFSCELEETLSKMKTFVTTLYNYNFTGTERNEQSDEEDDEMEIAIQEDPANNAEEGGEEGQDSVDNAEEPNDNNENPEPISLPVESEIDIVVID